MRTEGRFPFRPYMAVFNKMSADLGMPAKMAAA